MNSETGCSGQLSLTGQLADMSAIHLSILHVFSTVSMHLTLRYGFTKVQGGDIVPSCLARQVWTMYFISLQAKLSAEPMQK